MQLPFIGLIEPFSKKQGLLLESATPGGVKTKKPASQATPAVFLAWRQNLPA
jgi:hypothetical protein